jgi:hypothetical protein
MQASVTWKVVVLGGALLWGACSKERAPAEAAPTAQPEQAPKPDEQPAAAPEAAAEAPSGEPQAAAPAEEDDTPREFKEGQKRAEVMRLFGTCAERKVFIPPGPKNLYVEVFQPKNTEVCKKRLGERQFTIRGGQLHQMTPGLIPPPPPSTGTAENM